jgi:hypothetical protein
MLEQRLPIATRWTLYALGAVEGQRMRRPRDPVAAWLLRRHPKLQPQYAAPSILAMIRARTAIVDRMITEEAVRVRVRRQRLDYWTFGGGFDARWLRLEPVLGAVVREHREVEEPEVIEYKESALGASSFSKAWQRIQRVPVHEDRWTVGDATAEAPLVVLEGVASRVGLDGVRRILGRIRRDAPTARVIVDLPGILQAKGGTSASTTPAFAVLSTATRWSSPTSTSCAGVTIEEIKRLGWRPVEDVWLAGRPELRAPSGMALCPGVEPLRVLRLAPAE